MNIIEKTNRYTTLLKEYARDKKFNEFLDLLIVIYKSQELEHRTGGNLEKIYNNEFDMLLNQINKIQSELRY